MLVRILIAIGKRLFQCLACRLLSFTQILLIMKSHITTGLLICLLLTWMSPATILAQSQTYIVTTVDDVVDANDNLLSLREAVTAANANTSDGDVIQFSSALSGQTISLNLGELVIEDDVVIGDDTSPVAVTIDAAGASRIFSVLTQSAMGSRTVTFLDLAFVNGLASNGGALLVGEEEDVHVCDVSLRIT